MRESAITTGHTIETLRADENAASWANGYMASNRQSWQRNEAETGLIARATLLRIGALYSIDQGVSRKDARLVINGMPYSIAAIAA